MVGGRANTVTELLKAYTSCHATRYSSAEEKTEELGILVSQFELFLKLDSSSSD